jgi:hypothetical protein
MCGGVPVSQGVVAVMHDDIVMPVYCRCTAAVHWLLAGADWFICCLQLLIDCLCTLHTV